MGLGGIKISNLLAKATGVAALGMVAYDAHKYGAEEAHVVAREAKAETLSHHMYNEMTLDSPSFLKADMKKKLFNMHADETMSTPFQNLKGYIGGFTHMLVDNIVPLGLALGTMFGDLKGKGKLGNVVSKFSAIGLAAYGGLFILREGFGILKGHNE